MTTPFIAHTWEECPAINSLKLLSGKWKANIFLLATFGPVRFNSLLRQLPSANKQSLSIALKEMEQAALLERIVVKQKPLHIEYHLTEKGRSVIDVLRNLENIKIQHLADAGGVA
jgi:DNA-binding HxlR family transcriptional regulator